MEFKELDKLIEKYLEGETSSEEENRLKDFLLSRDILPEKYLWIKSMFSFYKAEKADGTELVIGDIVSFQPKKHARSRLFLYAVAACAVVLSGFWFLFDAEPEKPVYAYINGKPVENQEQAYAEAQKALMLVSKNLNHGAKNIGRLSELDKAISNVKGN
ncbi:MAG: hypothetical protein U0W24_18135 [Bacteroidales bacterium]